MNRGASLPSLSILTTVEDSAIDKQDMNENFLNLRPDPTHFVSFLEKLNRSDITSEIFVFLLNSYHDSKLQTDSDPMRLVSSYTLQNSS